MKTLGLRQDLWALQTLRRGPLSGLRFAQTPVFPERGNALPGASPAAPSAIPPCLSHVGKTEAFAAPSGRLRGRIFQGVLSELHEKRTHEFWRGGRKLKIGKLVVSKCPATQFA